MKKIDGFEIVSQRLLWYFSIVKKFTKLKMKCTMTIVIVSIMSQILMLASFIVPLKMLFIFDSGDFKELSLIIYTVSSKNELAFIFSLIMSLLFFSFFMLERFSTYSKKRCAKDIWSTSKSFQIYENQENMANKFFQHYTLSLSSLILIISTLLVLSFLYSLVAVTLIFYWLIVSMSLIWLFTYSESLQKSLEEDFSKTINILSLLGFLVVFLAVISDFNSSKPSSTLVYAIISLMLLRHMTGSIRSFLQSIKILYNQQDVLEKIFFKHNINNSLVDKKQKKFWQLFENDLHKKSLSKIVYETLESDMKCVSFNWFELEIPNTVAYLVTLENGDKLLIKIYNKNLHTRVLKANALLCECDLGDLTIDFLGVNMVNEYLCHIYKYRNYTKIEEKDFHKQRIRFLEKTSMYELPSSIVEKHRSTYRLIYERFSIDHFQRLKLAANDSEMILLEWFKNEIESIYTLVEKLPLRLIIPNINQNILVKNDRNEIKTISFDNWTIEPLGYAFTEEIEEQKLLETLLDEKELLIAKIVQNLKEYEHNCNRNSFLNAIQNIEKIKYSYLLTGNVYD